MQSIPGSLLCFFRLFRIDDFQTDGKGRHGYGRTRNPQGDGENPLLTYENQRRKGHTGHHGADQKCGVQRFCFIMTRERGNSAINQPVRVYAGYLWEFVDILSKC